MSTRPYRVMFYVQHLLGVGHVRRASLLAAGMVESGLDVHVVLGGEPVPDLNFPGADVHLLPAAHASDASFSDLLDATGETVDDAWRDNRRACLLNIFEALDPDVVMIEQFPFGRRQFRFELLPLLEAAHARDKPPKIVCSVRDILVRKNNPKRLRETIDTVSRYVDHVLVHGDRDFIAFDMTFDDIAEIAEKVHYTGYVTPPIPDQTDRTGQGEIIVASGGGAVGEALLLCSAQARQHTELAKRTWRFLIGPNMPEHAAQMLHDMSDEHMIVEPNRSDYSALLSNCALSISQGGYNTLMDIITVNCRAVVVPFSDDGENEQLLRTQALAERGHLSLLRPTALTPKNLAASIDCAISADPPSIRPFRNTGSQDCAQFIKILCGRQ